MNEFDPNKLKAIVRAIRRMIKCPSCQAQFQESDIEMVTGVGPSYFVKMSCGMCGVSVMASLVQVDSNELAGEVRPMTAPTKAPVAAKPVSSDDVIEVHKFLKDFDGDFQSIM